jgi:hypothetical protein
MYPGAAALKSTRPPGSGDLAQNLTGYSYSGFVLRGRFAGARAKYWNCNEDCDDARTRNDNFISLTHTLLTCVGIEDLKV